MNFSDMFNSCKMFDSIKDFYAGICYSKFFEKNGFTIFPLKYSLDLSDEKNCDISSSKGEKDREKILTTNQWLNLIEQIPFYASVDISGASSLSKEDLREILSAACKKTLNKVNLEIDASNLSDEFIDAVIEYNVSSLSVVLYDNKDKEDYFNKAYENLNNLAQRCHIEKSKLIVNIKTFVLKDNLEDLLKIYQYATNQGFDFCSVYFLTNCELKHNPILRESFDEVFYKEKYPIELYFDIEKFEKVFWGILKMKKFSKTKIRFFPQFDEKNPKREIDLIKKYFLEYNSKDIKEIYEPCKYPFINTKINSKGDVYPCLSCKMGNIKEQRLFDILNNPKYRCFRKNLKYSKVFSSCQMCPKLKVNNIQM